MARRSNKTRIQREEPEGGEKRSAGKWCPHKLILFATDRTQALPSDSASGSNQRGPAGLACFEHAKGVAFGDKDSGAA